ncbi:MAG: hypothetical protein AUK47_05255 [Deltaproteobacteria bacterium CG2_30_63_29]|nr:MAG: hypothetical protein AUK47_05255 [Deltaproteobacteria bacterium CG2_30_63_29]
MNARDASSFDLRFARGLSKVLSGETKETPSAKFTRFSAARFVTDPPAPLSAPMPALVPLETKFPSASAMIAVAEVAPTVEVEPKVFDDWDAVVDWSLEYTQAESAFLADFQGFLISSTGSWDFDDLEAIGIQLQSTADRANQMEGAGYAKTISLEFHEYFVVGLNFPAPEGGFFTLGIIGSKWVPFEKVDIIAREVRRNLSSL